ncbi:hypothetical protein NF27_HQ00600 [Candidatus Jidaibacter acanthamoeba]|uniref:Uncharacterized protein n=1 Tax=Candidatus Jidaibacter acanthamoebae TaxID=86105 RepID=A0A0C1MR84_9RICK|nr:hypothetical protein [Candidatus Jidaibacter acanthamoeba]KIE04522.1 hypothetical protein NF27_HQ00600 [Candidatus Jidaibacter acanthamoeba]
MKFSDIKPYEPVKLDNVDLVKKQGWLWFQDPSLESTSGNILTERTFEKENKFYESQVEFRIPVEPTKENIEKAYAVLAALFNDPKIKSPKNAKIIDINDLTGKGFADWNPEVGEVRQYDQRGKEICFYVTWDRKRGLANDKNPRGEITIQPSLSAEEYKTFMLTALKALIDAGVEGVGYYPTQGADKSLSSSSSESELPTIFTYLDFTSTDKSVFLHKAEYEANGFHNPLADIQLTLEDYLKAGIKLDDLANIRERQVKYLTEHFSKTKDTFLNELKVINQYDKMSFEESWLKKVESILDNIKNDKNLNNNLNQLKILLSEKSESKIIGDKLPLVRYLADKENLEEGDKKLFDELINLPSIVKENVEKNVEQIMALFPNEVDRNHLINFAYDNPDKISVLGNTAQHLNSEQRLHDEIGKADIRQLYQQTIEENKAALISKNAKTIITELYKVSETRDEFSEAVKSNIKTMTATKAFNNKGQYFDKISKEKLDLIGKEAEKTFDSLKEAGEAKNAMGLVEKLVDIMKSVIGVDKFSKSLKQNTKTFSEESKNIIVGKFTESLSKEDPLKISVSK